MVSEQQTQTFARYRDIDDDMIKEMATLLD